MDGGTYPHGQWRRNAYGARLRQCGASEYCSVCDESWVTNVSEEGPIVYTEAHYFWEGVCEGCGAENTCFHAHVHSHDDFVADIVYEPIDEKTHKVTGTTQDWNFCP